MLIKMRGGTEMHQVWHHYETWEEFHAGMWRIISNEEARALLPLAIEFTADHAIYGSYMQRVIKEWPISCEHNLTNTAMNRRAWIGHAACCLAIKCPENITRQAWKHLTLKQQDDANAQADLAIMKWEQWYAEKDFGLGQEVGGQGVFQWNP